MADSQAPDPDEVEAVNNETARKAQRVVAAYATDADECRMLLDMLGISPLTAA
ncbi:hypothetical protein GCM10027047_32690 [Rhodococcus aerolatus]